MKPLIAVNYQIGQSFRDKLEHSFRLLPISPSPFELEHYTVNEQVTALVTGASIRTERDVLAIFPNLQMIAVFGSGFDRISPELIGRPGLQVVNTPVVNADAVSEFTVAMLLSLVCKLDQGDRHVRSGRWVETGERLPLRHGLHTKSVGILGLGSIGRRVAAHLTSFGAEIGYHNRDPIVDERIRYFPTLMQLAVWADVLIATPRVTPSSVPLITREVLRALGPNAILVNVSRGCIVAEASLEQALEDGDLYGLALDVYSEEPCLPQSIMKHPNTILTPHMAGGTIEAHAAMADAVVRELKEFFSSETHRAAP